MKRACRVLNRHTSSLITHFRGDRTEKFFWGSKGEVFIPLHRDLTAALQRHRDARLLVNFASHRVAFDVTMAALDFEGDLAAPRLDAIAIIAEGIPERLARRLRFKAKQRGVVLIGPATVGAIRPGCFKIGNTAGMMDNILASKLYRPGRSVLSSS